MIRVLSYPGCFRRASSVSEVAAAVTEAAMAGVIASSSGQADTTLNNLAISDRADAAAQHFASSTSTVDNSTTGSATNEANDQAGTDDFGIDTDQMAMRLALDVLWTGGGSGVTKPAVPASGSAESDVL